MTKQEIAEQLHAIQATIDSLLDRLVGIEKASKPTKKKPAKKTKAK